MATDELQAAYLEVMMDEPGTSLEEFMVRVDQGRYGAHSAERITAFLHAVERNILGSIGTRAANNPAFAAEAEDRADEVRGRIAELVARYAPRSKAQS